LKVKDQADASDKNNW